MESKPICRRVCYRHEILRRYAPHKTRGKRAAIAKPLNKANPGYPNDPNVVSLHTDFS